MRRFVALLILAGCADQNGAYDLAPKDPGKATVILGVAVPDNGGSLVLAGYDPARHILTGSPVHLDLASPSGRGFIWKQVEPGAYAIVGFSHKHNEWSLCFAEDTASFAIRPGERLLIGAVDPAPLLDLLTAEVAARRDFHSPPGETRNYNLPLAAGWTNPQAEGTRTLRLSFNVIAPGVRPAAMVPARFGPGCGQGPPI